jgi:hypothetical protein
METSDILEASDPQVFQKVSRMSEGGEFLAFAARRLGLGTDEARVLVERGLVPFVTLALRQGEHVVPSPAVGTLFDMARERGGAGFRALLAGIPEALSLEPEEYLERYRRTRDLIAAHFGPLDEQIWPPTEAFNVEFGGYKGSSVCPNS